MKIIFLIVLLSAVFSFPAKADYCSWQVRNEGNVVTMRKGNVEIEVLNTHTTLREVVEQLIARDKAFDVENEDMVHALSGKNGKTYHTFIFKEGTLIPILFNIKTSAIMINASKRYIGDDIVDVLTNCRF